MVDEVAEGEGVEECEKGGGESKDEHKGERRCGETDVFSCYCHQTVG